MIRIYSSLAAYSLALAVFCVTASTSLSQETSDLSAEEQLQNAIAEGDRLVEEGKLEEAAEAYSNATKLGWSPLPFAKRAHVYAQLEEYAAALQDYKDAIERSGATPNVEALNGRAEVFMELGAYDQALGDLQLAQEQDRGNPQITFNLGKTLTLLGGAEQGLKQLDKYIGMAETENAEAYRLRAQAKAGLGKIEEARQDINHALALDPEDHESHFVLALIEVQEKNHTAAAKALSESIANFTPKKGQEDLPHVQAHLLKASVHEELGKTSKVTEEKKAAYEEQIAECNRLLDNLPDTQQGDAIRAAALFRRGVGERLLGQLSDAVQTFSEALAINPNLAEAYFRRGICFREMNEEKLALRDFEHAAAIEFDTPRAYFWQGLTWAKLGDFHKAIAAYGEAISQSERYTPAYVNRGLAYMQLGDYAKAIDDFNEAIRLESNGADHYYKRGVAYSLDGQHAKAVASLTKAIKYNPEMAPAYAFLADELDRLGRSDLAAEYRRKARELENQSNEVAKAGGN